MWTGGFPEPLTFSPARPPPSARPARRVRRRPRQPDPRLRAAGRRSAPRWSPPSTTPSPSTGSWSWTPPRAGGAALSVRRWYALHPHAEAGRAPAAVRAHRLRHLPPGDRRPPRRPRRTASTSSTSAPTPTCSSPDPSVAEVPGRIVTTSSADVPLKGLVHLVEALAKVRTEHPDAHLVVVGKRAEDGPVAAGHRAVRPRGRRRVRQGHHRRRTRRPGPRAPQVACVPSLYEGFSLPAAEAMATGTPLVATTGGAIPEVAGPDGETCLAVPPGDAGALAAALGRLLGDPELRGPARARPDGERVLAPVHLGAGPPRARSSHYREAIAAPGRAPAPYRRHRAVPLSAPRRRRRPRGRRRRPTRHPTPPTAKAGPRADRRLLPLPARRRATASWTSAAAPAGTPSSATGAAPRSWPSTRTARRSARSPSGSPR